MDVDRCDLGLFVIKNLINHILYIKKIFRFERDISKPRDLSHFKIDQGRIDWIQTSIDKKNSICIQQARS